MNSASQHGARSADEAAAVTTGRPRPRPGLSRRRTLPERAALARAAGRSGGRPRTSDAAGAEPSRWRGRWPPGASGSTHGEHYLRPTFKALFPDPSSFADMDLAARLIVDALVAGRRTMVFADYDVDGATSAAQLVRWFRAMGADLPIYVPDRLTEGYGPSPAAFRRLKAEGVELVITVDCGAAAYDALNAAAEIGLEVVVVDHHLMRGGAEIGRGPGQSQPPGLRLGAGEPGRRRRHLRPAGGAEPRGAAARPVRRPARARPAPVARPRGPGRDLRRHPADRLQPRPDRAGAEGDVGLGQPRPGGPDGRGRREDGRGGRLRGGLRPRPADQRRRPDRPGRPRRAPAVHRRPGRGGGPRRSSSTS